MAQARVSIPSALIRDGNSRSAQFSGIAQSLLPRPSEDGEFVYAVSEMNDSTAALSSLAFDRETGELRLLNTVPPSAPTPATWPPMAGKC